MTPARFRWGMLLVLLGVLLLLRNLDVIGAGFWEGFIIYLPIVLIAIGIEKIFTHTRARVVAYLTTVLIFVGGVYLAFAARHNMEDSFFSETNFRRDADPNVHALRAVLSLDRGSLTVRDATDALVDAQFQQFSSKPKIDYKVNADQADLQMTSQSHRLFGGLVRVDTGDQNDWYLSFSNTVPLALECSGDKSDVHLNLASSPAKSVKVADDDGTIYLKLGTLQPLVDVNLGGENAEVRLRVPQSVGLQISGTADDEYLSRIGLTKRDQVYVNDGFDTTSTRIDVKLDDRLSSLNIDFY